jgi:aminopeptidase
MENIYSKYADLLVNYSLELKKGDKFLVVANHLAEPLLQKLSRSALQAGAHPEYRLGFNGQQKIHYDYGSDEQIEYVSPASKLMVEEYDAWLTITSPFNMKELVSVDPEKIKKQRLGHKEINDTFLKRAAEGALNWTLCVFPTDAAAQECDMSLDEYHQFVFKACFLDADDPIAKWKELRDSQQKFCDYLNTKDKIRYLSSDVDVTFSCKGRKWLNSAGTNNMPSGEVFSAPVEDSVNGKVRFSYPGFYMGKEIADISLEIKDGEVVKWQAGKGQEILDKIFEVEGARRFGEVAVGCNHGIDKFTKNMLFDEKIGGTIHMAVGAAYPETGGTNESAIHWDMLADMTNGGEIYADDELIYKNGKFII